ncbi:MAG TPA: apolipoprotein N-acyltransferase, partial [Gemmataceae bacterium]|nr:apolipoprotein N-acyltransferase [Gemmataceae bacterium]
MENQLVAAGSAMTSPDTRRASVRRPSRFPRHRTPAVVCLLASLVSGILLYACHYPLAWGWLGWVALVPLLCLVRTSLSGWKVYASAWLGSMLFFWAALSWMTVADYRMVYTWAALATYCSLFFPLGIYLVRRLDRGTRLPLVVTLPVVWTALECLRGNFATGFGWYLLGYTQQAALPVIQIADLGGVYAVSLVVAAINALVFEVLFSQRWFRRAFRLPEQAAPRGRWTLALQAAGVLLLLGGTLAYGFWQLGRAEATAGPTLALIQGNLDQRIRNSAAASEEQAAETMFAHYDALCRQAVEQQPRPDLVVWPETSYPGDWIEAPAGRPTPYSLALAARGARCYRANVLLGLNAIVQDEDRQKHRYNSAVLIGADGKPGGRYDKIHRVLFGEFVPLRDWLPWMDAFAPYDFDYSIRAGEHQTRFALGPYRFGVLICFEDSDPELSRHYGTAGGDGPAVDFLVNISNDGWFDGSSEHEEHLAVCRFRAIESRRAVARAVNMGIS